MSSETSGGTSSEQSAGSSPADLDLSASAAAQPQPDISPANDASSGQPTQPPSQPSGFAPAAADPWAQQPGQPGPFSQPAASQPEAGFPAPGFPAAGFPAAGQSPSGQVPPGPYSTGPYPQGQGQAGQYGYQPQYFTPTAVRTNPLAVAALCCGIAQFVLLIGNILAAIPAIILGAIALKQIRLRGERGRGMAIAGLILGILGVVFFLLVIVVIIAVGVNTSNSGTS
jgi:hypothetical protein